MNITAETLNLDQLECMKINITNAFSGNAPECAPLLYLLYTACTNYYKTILDILKMGINFHFQFFQGEKPLVFVEITIKQS